MSAQIAILPLTLLLFQTLAFGKTLPWSLIPFELGHWIWVVLSLVFCVGLVSPNPNKTQQLIAFLEKRPVIILWVLLNLVYLAFSFLRFRDLGYQFPWLGTSLVIFSALFCKPNDTRAPIVFNLAILVASIYEFPINVRRSDMLPVVERALNQWSLGLDPYHPGQINGVPLVYGYLPGIFISYFPAWLLSLDLRWCNFLYRAMWLVFLNQLVKKSQRKEALLAFQYLALSPYLNFRHDLYFESFILLLVAYFRFSSFRFLALPLMCVTRQWSWVLVPFLLISDWTRNPKLRWKSILNYFLGGVATLCLLTVVLWGRTSLSTLLKSVFWFQSVVVDPHFVFDYGLNFKWFFLKLGWVGLMQKIQLVLWFLLLLNCFRNTTSRNQALEWGFISWVFFIMFNGHYWLYFWNSVIVFSIIVLTQTRAPEKKLATCKAG